MDIGFFAAHEQHSPADLLEHVVRAESVGYDTVWTSDHVHPWWHTDAHCGAAHPWLGAALERTNHVRMGTGVTPPIARYHPGFLAQTFATLGAMYPGRVHLALGTGEAMNEVPLGYDWVEYPERRRRLIDACEIIGRLWDGGFVDYDGEYWGVNDMNLYTRPDERVPLYVAAETLLREVVGFNFHRGALAAGRRHALPSVSELVDGLAARRDRSLVVLPEVTGPENLGLIVRSAAALGAGGVVLGERCCDPFSRRALRLSMGSVLEVPLARSRDLTADLVLLKQQFHYELFAAVLDAGAEPLSDVRWPARPAILFGNEFEGLRDQWLARCDRRITIPMRPGVDSLNLGVAAGVFLYELQQASAR